MERVLYHGSQDKVEKPLLRKGKRNNDFGQGFYCTEDSEMAKEWAVKSDMDGFANAYRIKEDGLQILNLTDGTYTCLNWIEILLQNRRFDTQMPIAIEAKRFLHEYCHVEIEGYDVIIGYRADDSYFSYANAFINNTISCGQLYDALHLGNLGKQYVLKSKKAFEQIEFLGYEVAPSEVWLPIRKARDQKARRAYMEMDTMRYIKNDIYIMELLDGKVSIHDSRIR